MDRKWLRNGTEKASRRVDDAGQQGDLVSVEQSKIRTIVTVFRVMWV